MKHKSSSTISEPSEVKEPELLTIGVYGYDEDTFFGALAAHHVDVFCDIRARRGVRGRLYTFANSAYLQNRLKAMGIRYLHLKELAPSKRNRTLQDEDDKARHIPKRKRTKLGSAFIETYQQEVLSTLDASDFLRAIGPDANVVALFCVEHHPEACHRSLLAEKLGDELNLTVRHIVL